MDQNVDKTERFPGALRIPQQMLKKDLQNLLAKLYEKTGQRNIMTKIKQRRFRWFWHTVRSDPNNISKVAIKWTSDGICWSGRPKETWRRTLTTDLKNTGKTWGEMQKIAKDLSHWKSLITAFCATRHEEVK